MENQKRWRFFGPVLKLLVFVAAMVSVSVKLYSNYQVPPPEPVYDMSLYYNSYPPKENRGFCGNATSRVTNGIDGEKLFKVNCSSCHKAGQVLIGPALMGAKQRWQDAGIGKEFYNWVRNPKKTLAKGHRYVKNLVDRFKNQALMPAYALSYEEIDAVLNYIGD